MSTNFKWNPGHYVMTTPNTPFDEVLPQIASIPNLRGIQERIEWKELETAKDVYTAAPILTLLNQLDNQPVPAGTPKKRLRVLLTYKSFARGAYATPGYIQSDPLARFDDGAPLYRTDADGNDILTQPVFGVYNYGVGWHPKFYNPWVADRFAKLMQALGPLLDGHPLLEDIYFNETAFGGAQVPINGLNWNNADGLQRFRERATGIANALFAAMTAGHQAFPTTVIGQYVNFPNTGKFSIIKDAANPALTPGWPAGTALPPKMARDGLGLGGPDAWLDDDSADNGPFQMYRSYRGVIPLSPSIQNADYSYLNHADQSADNPTGTITIQELYYKATQHPNNADSNPDNNVVTLYGTHVTWSAADYAAPAPHTQSSWAEVKAFFLDKWNVGPDAGNLSPGVDTAIPATLLSPAPPVPAKPVLKLLVDSGVSATDLITNTATVVVDNPVAGGTVEWSLRDSGPWSTTQPTLLQGVNQWYARQKNSVGMVSEVSDPFLFEFCNTTPSLAFATVRETYILVTWVHPINLTNAPRPSHTSFTVRVNGNPITLTGTFVNEDQKRLRLDWTTPLTGGETVTVSYTVPTTNQLQDVAGNLVAAFADVSCINLIGLPELTASAAITSVAGVGAGGFTRNTRPTLIGTVSETLAPTMDVVLHRQKKDGAFRFVEFINATGTSWTYTEPDILDDERYTYRVRVQHGDLVSTASWSPEFQVTIDTEPPGSPTIDSLQVRTGNAFTLTGTWSNDVGDTLQVAVAGVGVFTSLTGLVVSGVNWSLNLPALPVGRYNVGASTSDLAGNVAFNENPAEIIVTPGFGKSAVILRTYKRRTV